MDPFILGFGALVVWKWRFSQRSQMARLLRSAVVDGPSQDGDVRPSEPNGAGLSIQMKEHHVSEGQRRTRWDTAGTLLVVHAVVAVSAAVVQRNPGPEIVLLLSLLLHMMYYILSLRRSALPEEPLTTTRDLPSAYRTLNGRYIKDRDASDPMDPCCDLMMIHGIKRYALRFIVGSDVEFSDRGDFSFAAFSVIKWFKIRESYAWLNGMPSNHRRRDLRSGGMVGTAVVREDGHGRPEVTVLNRFGGFREGTLREVFTWPAPGVMEVHSVLENEAGRVSFKQVFRRAAPSSR